jgi:hypothetical protein
MITAERCELAKREIYCKYYICCAGDIAVSELFFFLFFFFFLGGVTMKTSEKYYQRKWVLDGIIKHKE